MVFIDAFHQYKSVMEDLRWATALQVPIISGHDYCDKYPGVLRAVDETFGDRYHPGLGMGSHQCLIAERPLSARRDPPLRRPPPGVRPRPAGKAGRQQRVDRSGC